MTSLLVAVFVRFMIVFNDDYIGVHANMDQQSQQYLQDLQLWEIKEKEVDRKVFFNYPSKGYGGFE